jgi:hypothetical protein
MHFIAVTAGMRGCGGGWTARRECRIMTCESRLGRSVRWQKAITFNG